jgi:hypothetical protein
VYFFSRSYIFMKTLIVFRSSFLLLNLIGGIALYRSVSLEGMIRGTLSPFRRCGYTAVYPRNLSKLLYVKGG